MRVRQLTYSFLLDVFSPVCERPYMAPAPVQTSEEPLLSSSEYLISKKNHIHYGKEHHEYD